MGGSRKEIFTAQIFSLNVTTNQKLKLLDFEISFHSCSIGKRLVINSCLGVLVSYSPSKPFRGCRAPVNDYFILLMANQKKEKREKKEKLERKKIIHEQERYHRTG